MVKKEFKYRGYTLEQLQGMTIEEFAKLVCSNKRRSLARGLIKDHKKLVERARKIQGKPVRTHCRDMIILPEFVGKIFAIYNGKEYVRTDIIPEMIGSRLGEFVVTRRKVSHSSPGVGATRSSKFVSLK
jgi:small subunit ribosomal protein S19|tara:strand:- start:2626 stop:3012 length:387 start_codon:yes stop_codon:yes gene_type:complete